MRFVKIVLAAVVTATTAAGMMPAASAAPDPDRTLMRYATATWRSFDAMVDETTGLPADNISGNLREDTRSAYTSPTNIGGYLWSTVVARDLRIIDGQEAYERMSETLDAVAQLDRHDDSGMFYNWYNPATLEVLRIWPEDGNTVHPFLSSVDNGWLAAALKIVASAEPRLREEADALFEMMDFGFYYDPAAKADVGLIRQGVLGRAAARVFDRWQLPGQGPGCLLHLPSLRRLQLRAADRVVHRDRDRPDPARALLRAWRTFPAPATGPGATTAGSASGGVPRRAGLGGRVRLPATTSCPPGAGRCSKP